jgi:protein-disulfide isomerase
MPRRYSPEQKQNSSNKIIIIGVVAAIILVIAFIVFDRFMSNSGSPTLQPAQINASGHDCGNATSPITVEEYADLQCPVCAKSDMILHQLGPQYMETGKVRVIFKHFAFIGQESTWAAEAAECAVDQNKFWPYVDYVFNHQAGENQGSFSRNALKGFAAALQMDLDKFSSCFDAGKYSNIVQQQTDEGRKRGVRATPSFFVNGQFVEGLPSQQQFSGFFETLLKK